MPLNSNVFGQYLFGDLLPVPILSVTEDRYLPGIQRFVAAENAIVDELASILCDKGTDVQSGFLNNVGGRLHKIAKRGGAEATRAGQRWWLGYPIYAYGSKQTYEIPWLERATFVDLAASILNATLQDIETVIAELINGITQNVNFTFDDSQWPGHNSVGLVGVTGLSGGPVNVRRLANADGATGSVWAYGNEVQLGTLNHYLVSGAANPAVAAFQVARDALRNVGNDSDVNFIVNRTDADYIQGNFTLGTDFIPPVEILNTQLAQAPVSVYAKAGAWGIYGSGPRDRGRVRNYGKLVEWPHWPQGYIFAYDATKDPPLRMRVSDLPKYQGFGLAPDDPNDVNDVQGNPLARKQWRRIFGIGARNRTNGVMVQITSNGSYTAPALL